MAFTKITIEALIAASPEKVWDYYNTPKHITQWNYASDDWHCPKAENDMKMGGTYLARMEAKDGSFGFDFKAIYDEIIPMAKVAYTLGDERKVVTTFEKQGEQTKVTTVFDAEGMNPIDMQKAGWQAILNNFKRYTETY